MRSGLRIAVEGFNQLRLLNALTAGGVAIFDFSRETNAKCDFWVCKKDALKTFAILRELCYTYRVVQERSVKSLFKTVARRAGLLATVVCLTACILFLRGFAWRVEIHGCDAVPQKTIARVLAENGVKVGGKLSFNAQDAEAAVRRVEGVRLASVRKIGTTVRVEVFESEEVAPPLAGSTTDILSAFDATVTRVVAREGTALVTQGQHILAGTPLIGAYRTGAEGEPIPSRASGIVYGIVTHATSVTVSEERYELVAAAKRHRTVLRLFGLTVGKPLKAGEGVAITAREKKLNAFLPITVVHQDATVYEKRLVHESVETLAEKAAKEALLGFVSTVASTGFTEHHTVRSLGGGQFRVNIFIEAETVIGGA